MERPKVSICIPCYNNADEVERLLTSVYRQEYTDFEVNLSDDSTNDETERLVRERYAQVRYQHNQTPYGHIFNWNAALRMADGAYIKVMFSDDWFTDATSLGSFVTLLDENPDAMLAFSGSRQVMLDGQNGDALRHVTAAHQTKYYDRAADALFIDGLRKDYRHLFLGNQIGAPSAVIYRRGSALTLFDERSNWASDLFLYFDLLVKSPIFAYTKEPLVSIGVHENQYTESFAEKDERIYNDYKYMYTKYDLRESRACREYFTEQFLIKYHRGFREAKALGIGGGLFFRKLSKEITATVQSFAKSRFKKDEDF
ncbi:MAG: glycosyltransferase family 2 protein [Lachnospiraceae bacterium]|nr:glycosyltransferase family 2 protein [Lachnospiraceae bacterium]MDE7184229.1 glycosyltransferase family 2 protein [Lachnospiraceae bacterium]